MADELLRKILSSADSSNDAEALAAIRKASSRLKAKGLSLSDLADAVGLLGLTEQAGEALSRPVCRIVRDAGSCSIETAPAAKSIAIALPDAVWPRADEIGDLVSRALLETMVLGCSLPVSLDGSTDRTTVVLDSPSSSIKVWSGPRGEAAMLASVLRRAIAHALSDN